MIVQTKYGYKVDLGNLESDVYIENKDGSVVAVLTPMEIVTLRNTIARMIKADQKKN